MLSEIEMEVSNLIVDSPFREESSHCHDTAGAICNHSIAVGLLKASFDECKLMLSTTKKLTLNELCNISLRLGQSGRPNRNEPRRAGC